MVVVVELIFHNNCLLHCKGMANLLPEVYAKVW